MITEKSRVDRLRRAAEQQGGLMLVKSRRRDRRADDFGLYVLVDAAVSAFASGKGLTLDEAEREIRG